MTKLDDEETTQYLKIVKHPEELFWGGYSGYIADPDNNLWEISFNPFLPMDENGNTNNSDSLTIDIARLKDLDTILALQKTAYKQEADIYNNYNIPPLKQSLDSLKEEWQNGLVLKAEKNGRIVGSVRATLNNTVCEIGKLIVHPDFQNLGIGKDLLNEIESVFINCSTYELFTGYKSEKNLSIYRKHGYSEFKQEIIEDKLALIYLQKQNSHHA